MNYNYMIGINNNNASGGSLPSGTNIGDLLVWNGTEWKSKPFWRMMYQAVEYIESTGTQWIDTGYIPTANTGIKATTMHSNVSDDQNYLGCRVRNGARFCFNYTNGVAGYGYNGFVATDSDYLANTENTASLNYKNNGKFIINDDEYTITDTFANIGYSIYLFSQNDGEAGDRLGRVYSAEITEGTNVVRNFVPVRGIYTDVIGLYETVEGKFYGNNGSGTFLKGADVN